ncbi:methylcytosine dioxygenase TET-like [Topomyia yanbarensis]|uniref:methylcytosine dioxygenase TET-like n=1 Tax=Topomyia yanbarensis TaxID=2498891 RepID=UPI00273C1C56|nr:methylcytosine dioxygenase TET-like [Topomyia yanbarensis]
MAIAFYCEDEDPKLWYSSPGYYATIGYNSYQHHQQQQQQQQQPPAAAIGQSSQLIESGGDPGTSVDENNNNCALHDSDGISGGDSNGNVNHTTAAVDSNRQLMQVLHQVLYRFTSEGALSPAHTSCIFCNKIYYLFQLLY